MAILYGSAVAATGGNIRSSTRSIAHARSREWISTYDGTPTTSDQLVVGFMKSNDMLIDIEIFTDGNPTAGALNIGLYEADIRNDDLSLTAIDDDLFASAQSVTTNISFNNRISVFSEAGTLDDIMDRGKSLWSLAAVGAASYTEDPGLTVAVVATPSTSANAAAEIGFRIKAVTGD